jgi:hypothetical protein
MSGETEKAPSGWTVDTALAYMERQLEDMRAMLQERYETQTKAVDAAFLAQQTAMQTALTAAERAVATALLSAEKAVTKAELAADKRFDSVNEFRGQLADQTATLMPRPEYTAQYKALEDKLSDLADRVNRTEGRSGGFDKSWGIFLAIAGIGIAVVSLIIAIVGR